MAGGTCGEHGKGCFNFETVWPTTIFRYGRAEDFISRSTTIAATLKKKQQKLGSFLNGYSWKPHEVWFDKIECAIHGYNDAVSIVLMVDQKSQEDLTRWALKNERDLEISTGVNKRIPHTRLQNFHMTLGTLNQSNFPVQSAVEEINRVIPPGKWHKTPVILHSPVCKRCKKAIDAVSTKN